MKVSITKRATVSVNSAPAVKYPVGRASFLGYFLFASGVAGLLVGGLWIRAVAVVGGAQFSFFVALVVVFSLAGYAWRWADTGFLTWGGESWAWTTAQQSTGGSILVHCDIQFLMVVTLRDDLGQCVWLWVERAADPIRWKALRRAIYGDKPTGAVKQGVNAEASL